MDKLVQTISMYDEHLCDTGILRDQKTLPERMTLVREQLKNTSDSPEIFFMPQEEFEAMTALRLKSKAYELQKKVEFYCETHNKLLVRSVYGRNGRELVIRNCSECDKQ